MFSGFDLGFVGAVHFGAAHFGALCLQEYDAVISLLKMQISSQYHLDRHG